MLKEEWRRIPRYPDHAISNYGAVRFVGKCPIMQAGFPVPLREVGHPRPVKPSPRGYSSISMKGKTIGVHRLVLSTFVGPPPHRYYVVQHLDGNPRNNCVDNLRWVTQSENLLVAVRRGRIAGRAGEAAATSKLQEAQVREIRARFAAGGVTKAQLGREFKVTGPNIAAIVHGRTWKHLL